VIFESLRQIGWQGDKSPPGLVFDTLRPS